MDEDDNIQWNVEGRYESLTESARRTRIEESNKKKSLAESKQNSHKQDLQHENEYVDHQQREKLCQEDLFQEPKEMMVMSPPTGSMYLKTDELKLQKQKSSLSTSVNFASKLFGMMLFSLALIIYAFQTLLIKIAQKNNQITPQELLYYFSIVTVILSFITTKLYKEDLTQLEPCSYKAVTGRFLMGYFSDILLFVAFTYTNYSKGICIFFTNTLMIPFFARCMLKEKIKKVDIVAILLSFVGMVLIIQPFKAAGGASESMARDLIGVLLALLAAACGALSLIFNKQAAAKVHHSKMTTYYTAANVVISPIWSFVQQREVFPVYDWKLFLYILGIGIAFWAMQMLMTKSFKFITAGMAGILIYIAVPIGYVLDYLFLHTQVGGVEILGVGIIVGTNVIIGFLLYFGVIS